MRSKWIVLITVVAVVAGCAGVWGFHKHQQAATRRDACNASRIRQRAEATQATAGAGMILVIGDSYAEGEGATDVAHGFGALLGPDLERPVTVLAEGGSGYTKPGICGAGKFADRLASVQAMQPDLVVVEGGINDRDNPGALATEAAVLYSHLQPTAVVVGPALAPSLDEPALRQADELLSRTADGAHLRYLSLLTVLGPGDFGPDQLHPTDAGHKKVELAIAAMISQR